MQQPDVENIPSDLDRFLGNFFNRRGWRSEIKYDPAEDRLYLDVRLASDKLTADDRFFSLVEYYARAQAATLRRHSGLPLQCRVFGADGSDLSGTLHARGSSYLDDNARGSGMRRRLLLLGMRRRLFARVVPGALLWAATFLLIVGVLGVPLDLAVVISVGALALQALVLWSLTGRRR